MAILNIYICQHHQTNRRSSMTARRSVNEVSHFVSCCRTGSIPISPVEDSVTMEMLCAIYDQRPKGQRSSCNQASLESWVRGDQTRRRVPRSRALKPGRNGHSGRDRLDLPTMGEHVESCLPDSELAGNPGDWLIAI